MGLKGDPHEFTVIRFNSTQRDKRPEMLIFQGIVTFQHSPFTAPDR